MGRENDNKQSTELAMTPGVDLRIMVSMIFIMAFGLIMVFSASSYLASSKSEYNYDSMYHVSRQAVFMALGLGFILVIQFIPYKFIKACGIFAYIFSTASIFLLLTPLGISASGATRWLNLGFTQVQVADIVKVCMIVFMGSYISKYWKSIHRVRHILILWLLVGIQAILVFLISSNLSSCLILLLMVFFTTFIVSKDVRLHIVVLLIGVAIVGLFIYWLKTHMPLADEINQYPYQIRRCFAWLDPEKYADTFGYQPLQSLYAIGGGGLWGKGLGNGTQKLGNIPESPNDMIFSIICEELGLVGALLMFLMFGYLLYQMWVIVRESRNLYASVVVIGVMLHLIFQIIVNVCVAVNFFPNTGVSLPFISYGGSAIVCTMIECGMVIAIRRQQYSKKYSRLK